jgi:hypothetical protein
MGSSDVVRSGLADYFRMVQSKVHELTEPLSTAQLWPPYPYGNSIGNLLFAKGIAESDFNPGRIVQKAGIQASLAMSDNKYYVKLTKTATRRY